jgi:hypothetical protein
MNKKKPTHAEKYRLEQAAEKYRLKQAEKILSLFEDVHGHPARTMEELNKWATSLDGERYLANFQDRFGHIIPD